MIRRRNKPEQSTGKSVAYQCCDLLSPLKVAFFPEISLPRSFDQAGAEAGGGVTSRTSS